MHVVDDLREDARPVDAVHLVRVRVRVIGLGLGLGLALTLSPVDAVHRGEAVVGAEGRVVEERLDVRLVRVRVGVRVWVRFRVRVRVRVRVRPGG